MSSVDRMDRTKEAMLREREKPKVLADNASLGRRMNHHGFSFIISHLMLE